MFTAESFLNLAIELEAQHDAIQGRPGVACEENTQRYELRNKIDQALLCAKFMEDCGMGESRYVGPFGNLPVKRGMTIRIKKGTPIYGDPKGPKVAKTTYCVKVHQIYQGYAGNYFHGDEVKNPEIEWSGTGQYWYRTDANNVEIVDVE